MKLKSKLTLWSSGTIILVLAVSLVSLYSIKRLLYTTEYVLHTSQVIQHALLLEKYVERLEINVRNYTMFKKQASMDKYNEDKKLLYSEITVLRNLISTPSQREIINSATERIDKWIFEADKFLIPLNKQPIGSFKIGDINKMVLGDKYLNYIRGDIRNFYNNEQILMEKRKLDETIAVDRTFLAIEFATLFIIALYALLSYFIANGIKKPINKTSSLMKSIAEGKADLTKRIKLKPNDEVGEFIIWFNNFIDNLQKLIKEIKSEVEDIDVLSNSLTTFSTDLANNSVANSSAIEHMNNAMEEFSQVAEGYYDNTSEVLKKNEKNISGILSDTDEVVDLSNINTISEKLNSVSDFLIDLNKETDYIDVFIKEIKEISIQSKILSVNASVESSKAGEQGKTFSVIAEEIRDLAKNSELAINNATKTFTTAKNLSQNCALTIETIQKHLVDFIDKSDDIGEMFDHKVKSVNNISDVIGELTQSRKKHLNGLKILTEAMDGIKDASAENAKGAKNLASASNKLASLSDKLKENTDNFNA